ncbi:hypothetical protein BaRGS_00009509, partial [Batillaria attramentaria]
MSTPIPRAHLGPGQRLGRNSYDVSNAQLNQHQYLHDEAVRPTWLELLGPPDTHYRSGPGSPGKSLSHPRAITAPSCLDAKLKTITECGESHFVTHDTGLTLTTAACPLDIGDKMYLLIAEVARLQTNITWGVRGITDTNDQDV